MDLTGPYECSYASYDYVAKMIEQNAPSYLEPHRFTTRSAEVAREKPGKELVLDQMHLTVKDMENKDKCPMQGELQIFQAFTRRALACDLMGVCTFRCMEKWHRFLMDSMQVHAPPGYKSPTVEQILRADRAGWIRIAEKVDGLRRRPDGTLPLDEALDSLKTDPTTIFHMMPLPMPRAADKPTKPAPIKKDGAPDKTPKPNNFSKGKGKGKKPWQSQQQGAYASRTGGSQSNDEDWQADLLQLQSQPRLQLRRGRKRLQQRKPRVHEMLWIAPSSPVPSWANGLTTT